MRRILVALALLAIGCETEPTEPVPGARAQRISEEILEDYPDLRSRFDAMSYDEAFRDGGDLAQRGFPRLSDEELSSFMRQRHALLTRSDEACVAFLGGDGAAALEALESLSDRDLRSWLGLSTRAQHLELRGGARPMSREEARRLMRGALDRIRDALAPHERARWDRARSSTEIDEACFLERTILRELMRMPTAEGARYQRALLESALPR